jgi:hypothetical protein
MVELYLNGVLLRDSILAYICLLHESLLAYLELKMKILMINSFFGHSGGAENAVYATANVLKKNDHKVCFFATDKRPFFEEEYELANYFPKYIKYSSLNKFDLVKNIPRIFYNFEAEHKLDILIKRIKPDVAHVNYRGHVWCRQIS